MANDYRIMSYLGRSLLSHTSTDRPFYPDTSPLLTLNNHMGNISAIFSQTTMDTWTVDDVTNPGTNVTMVMTSAPNCSFEFRFWFATVGIGLLCLLGLVGNTLSILVLQKDNHNRVACFLLQALAFADNTALMISLIVVSFIYGLVPFLWNKNVIFNQTMEMLQAYIYKYGNPIASMAQCCTVWITVLLAINRYVAICKPFRVQKWCTPMRARLQVATVVIVAILFNIPRFFAYNIKTYTFHESGEEIIKYTLEPTVFGGNSVLSIIYNHVLLSLLVLGVPLIILTTLNTKLILEVRAIQKRARRNHSSAHVHEDNITLVMIVIILILLVCHTPDSIVQIIIIFLPMEQKGCSSPSYYASNVCNLLIILNSSTNFILYYFMRRGFRKILMIKLCGCVKGTYTSTSTMLNGIVYLPGKLKLNTAKSCPDFGGYSNGVCLTSLDELRKTSL